MTPNDPPSGAGGKTPSLSSAPADHEAMDAALGATGLNSIFQRVRRLNQKQRQVLELVLQGVPGAEACRRVGFKSTGPMATIREALPDLMDRVGLGEEFLIEHYLKPLLNAETTKFFKLNPDVVTVDELGAPVSVLGECLVESPPRPALDIRLSATRLAFDLHGSLKHEEPSDTDLEARDINVQIINVGG